MSKYCYIVALGMSAVGMLCLFGDWEEGLILLPIGVLVGLVGAVASLFEKDVDALRISGVTVVLVTTALTVAVLVLADGWSKLLAIPLGLLSGLALEIVMIVSLIRRRRVKAVARLVADGDSADGALIGEGNMIVVQTYAVAPLDLQAVASQVWQVLDPELARVFVDDGMRQLVIQASGEAQQQVAEFLLDLGVKRVSSRAVVSALKSSLLTIGMTLAGAVLGGVIGYMVLDASGAARYQPTGFFIDGIVGLFIAIFVIAVVCVSAFIGGALGLILGLVLSANRLKKVSSQPAAIPPIPSLQTGQVEPASQPAAVDPDPAPEPGPSSEPIPESEPEIPPDPDVDDDDSPYRLDD